MYSTRALSNKGLKNEQLLFQWVYMLHVIVMQTQWRAVTCSQLSCVHAGLSQRSQDNMNDHFLEDILHWIWGCFLCAQYIIEIQRTTEKHVPSIIIFYWVPISLFSQCENQVESSHWLTVSHRYLTHIILLCRPEHDWTHPVNNQQFLPFVTSWEQLLNERFHRNPWSPM